MQVKAWILAFIFGLIGVAISAAIFFGIVLVTGYVFGLVTIVTGALAGGLAGIGYLKGGGVFQTERQVNDFLGFTALIGIISVGAGYVLAPYVYMGLWDIDLITFAKFYYSLGGYSGIDILFVGIGGYGGYWGGQRAFHSLAPQPAPLQK